MFEVRSCGNRWGAVVFKIVNDNHNYLHGDGLVYPCGEYWPTREQAQAVLDKYQPKHVWQHGDVFQVTGGAVLVCVRVNNIVGSRPFIFNIKFHNGLDVGSCGLRSRDFHQSDVFLFNIKDKLPC